MAKSLDELFAEFDKEHRAEIARRERDPAAVARRVAKEQEELARDIRLGVRDKDGLYIESGDEDDDHEDLDDLDEDEEEQ